MTAAAGCGGSGRELARCGDLAQLDAVHLGPVGEQTAPVLTAGAADLAAGAADLTAGAADVQGVALDPGEGAPPGRGATLLPTPSGLVHRPARVLPTDLVVQDLLPWFRARGLAVTVAVRGGTLGEVVSVLQALRRSLDFTTITAVEIDLATTREETLPTLGGLSSISPSASWSADPQASLKLLAAVREQLPRDLLLLAKFGGECPDPVATARGAVGGGARALVLSGSVPALSEGHHLVGPATGVITLGLVRRIHAAIAAARVPQVPLVAVGGIHNVETARAAIAAGATGVQLGSALFADPALLWEVHAALLAGGPEHDGPMATEPSANDPNTHPRSTHDPSIHDPSIHDPSIHDPSIHDPSIHDPSIHDPSIHDPSTHDPSTHDPSTHTDPGGPHAR
ncbi:hypothetical protein FNH13_11625 [Ornithinimicrobium ciconiae]|uniref:Uncharacterized protein n=1 Tax=Ornithinimicrobium ciconiae TaxID=2594265 RepID=A0A516GBI5_9MICO|nr:hypothetical protein [Ornithinimicrobium ciconiae]QDO88894.1 hypothetical protein FNH13_11625 [Ornithinimicrobium ciconiae]